MYIERDVSGEFDLLDALVDDAHELANILFELDVPNAVFNRAAHIANGLRDLLNMLKQSDTYIVVRDNDDYTESTKYFDDGDYSLFYEASRFYAFSDLDNTYSISKIVFEGREVEYCGWDFGMHFVYKYNDTKEVAFENWYPQFDH